MSECEFVSPGTRFEAKLEKTIQRPSGEIRGLSQVLSATLPLASLLMSWVRPVERSRRSNCTNVLVIPGTRLVASLTNATNRPSSETDGDEFENNVEPLPPSPVAPEGSTLTHSVVFVFRSNRNTSAYPFPSVDTRLLAALEKATNRP